MSVKYHSGAFPPTNLDWFQIASALSSASDAVARYDSFLGIIPNPDVLIAPLITQEAVLSSRIEGTRATISDVFEFNAGKTDVPSEKRDDIQEITNYEHALRRAEIRLTELPLCGRVLREAHQTLLSGVRGSSKSPGQFRREQNWIGTPGSSIETARFVPASPDELEERMRVWEEYVNDEEVVPLVKTALAHAEFEAIHPFGDGNGRIGRMIIPLMMFGEGLISHPCFFMSSFFDRKNEEYADRLLAVSSQDDWSGWCVFFLDAVAEQASENRQRAERLHRLHESLTAELSERSRSVSAAAVVNKLFYEPAFITSKFINELEGVKPPTVRRLLVILRDEMGALVESRPQKGRRPSVMIFPELIGIVSH